MTTSHATPSPKGTAVVTGASAGIGRTYAQRLAARGFDLLLVARRAERLEALAQTLRLDHGVQVEVLAADLADAGALERVAQRLERDDNVTLLVNNAGVATFGAVAGTEPAALDTMTDVNVTAVVRLARAVLLAFKRRDRGTLVNIGSVLGFHALAFSGAYSGTKGYVLNFTRGLQEEVAGTNVVVQLVAPASTATDIWDLAGVPLATLAPANVMSTADLVDAALAGLDQGEKITLPSVEDAQLFADYDAARLKLLAASQTGKPASRYRVGR